MCGKTQLLSICATCGGQLPSNPAKPVISNYRLGASRKHRWIQPQKTGCVINWWWWRRVVVVALVLDQYLDQGILLLDQLGELRREGKTSVMSRRHLRGLDGRDLE